MATSIAHLGPSGTYAESAALACAQLFSAKTGEEYILCPYPSIIQTIYAVANQQTRLGVVPVENSIEGGVGATLDTLWQLDTLQIQQALVLPISHALLSCASSLGTIQTVYSHPQALAQCQGWLTKYLPTAQLIPTNSTTEALQFLNQSSTIAAIAPQRAAQLYNLPVLAYPINDHPDNCTRFWVLSLDSSSVGSHTSLAFSIPANVPGALVKTLQVFAKRDLNLSRIESRPTKRSLGDYLFFVDIEASLQSDAVQSALLELQHETESLKVFGSYTIQTVDLSLLFASQQQG
ncbi:prephenate dehydratase [Leptolyngbya sp. NK1-12]|uniref:Prephenate dehydratase n=1 Tax=Leptolyngbya sp. NK1-12 TaxID=2547451 RepID=A0AA96WHC7_9CYAN|nr:prephenate dehydratase [Leptolyngbya sp. NK1-12]MBF2050335.1 prephenate dehydratase [Elainella sp. C42_A2020_010]WNZ22356.1 prephenate dehydratase [Leptolyngbya sp. NK1-12]